MGGALPSRPAGLTGPQSADQAATNSSCCRGNHCFGPTQKGLRGGRSAPFPVKQGAGLPFRPWTEESRDL